jgi:cbb3-type cytochrome c oxidase subunit III
VRPVVFVAVVCAGALALALAGCGTGGYVSSGSQGSGKKLFVQACGGCHTLADAGTNGKIGPNLDDAFAQAREVGMTSDTFTQVVATQIRFPITNTSTGAPGMPKVDTTLPSCDDVKGGGFCVENQDDAVDDIATYVGSVAGTGAVAEAPTDGKSIFTANCAACHTLADAGTNGTVGPNLDDAKPSRDKVVTQVTNGGGGMPPFKGTLDPQQIQAVADYVSSVAGK